MRRILGMVAAISIVAAACSTGDEVVASVNGVDLNRSRVEILIPESAGETVPSEFSRFLTVVIQWEAVAQAAESDFGIEPTEQEIDVRLEEFVAGLADDTTLEAYLASVNASVAGIREFARQLVIQDGIESRLAGAADPISDDMITDELVNARLDWTVVCASHILVETVEDAEAVIVRLDGGEAFATVAGEVSLDPGSASDGGDLGCNSPSGFVDSFAAATMVAEIDVPTAPVESDFGFHIILVSQREEATQELVREALEIDALAAAVDDWFVAVIASAEVSVDEAIGVWVTEPTPQVLATN
ncbi:MAG: peptidylprolyl isomerase [Actinomycetota bacterium]|nr:peptidylprolyl isomerase [Actinomycetota bacterium]MDK1017583.1 peptidylprolyl isomerase [Actinomycetota bacterium]MDK1026446.1 peptidylprolyl isomerase [Actinomycetota bacterium]